MNQVSYSISNTTNFTDVGFGFVDPETMFPSIWGNVDFGFTVTFSVTEGTVVEVDVSAVPSPYTVEVISPNSVRIERNPNNNTFPNEYYDFVRFENDFQDKIEERLLPQEAENFDSESTVFLWNTPSIEVVTNTLQFNIKYFDDSLMIEQTTNKDYTQELHWLQTAGLNNLIDFVQRSKY